MTIPDRHMMTVEELRDRLERHDPIMVLDVRAQSDRNEWSIPGSMHIDVYDALKDGDVHALDDLDLTPETEVVTICGVGKTAAVAAGLLRSRGIPARTLAGGMKAWSLAWNIAEFSLPGSPARIVQVRRTGKGCLSYVIGSEREAVVIDASVDVGIYKKIAKEHGWSITNVIETHLHADHISRARQLAEETGATLRLPATERGLFPIDPLHDGDRIPVGASQLQAIATPGHTPESMSYLLDSRAIFSGDTLFLSGVGRPDLASNTGEVEGQARILWSSLRRLTELDPETLVLPGHTNAPIAFDEVPIAGKLIDVIHQVAALGLSEDAFIKLILGRLPTTPPNYASIVALNESDSVLQGDPTDLEAGANRCAVA